MIFEQGRLLWGTIISGLMGYELTRPYTIRATFEVELPLCCLFELPTIAELAVEIASRQARQQSANLARKPIIPRRGRSIDQQLEELHQLSDEEARRLLDTSPPIDSERDPM